MKAIPAAIALFAALPAAAEELEPPDGSVMLTVTGKIGHTNRLAFHPLRDKFVAFHERGFKKAAELDREMLESLGMSEAHIEFDGWNGPVTFRGPRLIDVLKKVGWHGAKITTLALDGFGTAISKPQIDAHNWILATRGNGKPFDIGQRGLLWLVFDPPGDRPATTEEEGKWPWAIFLIEVHLGRRVFIGRAAFYAARHPTPDLNPA